MVTGLLSGQLNSRRAPGGRGRFQKRLQTIRRANRLRFSMIKRAEVA